MSNIHQTQRQIEYQIYLQTDHWKNTRYKILEERGCKCEKCGEYGNEIHHLTYENLWRENPSDLQVLCDDCHDATHRALKYTNPNDRYTTAKKIRKISRGAIVAALSKKQRKELYRIFYDDPSLIYLDNYNYNDTYLLAIIMYSNDPAHKKFINISAKMLGFTGYYPHVVKQQSHSKGGYRPDPYKNKPVRPWARM